MNFTLRKTAPTLADLHVGNRRKGVQGVTYFVLDIILGPTVLAKTVNFLYKTSKQHVCELLQL